MKKYKVFLLVVLPGFITLIYLYCNEATVSRKTLINPILNSRVANTAGYLKQEDQKLTPKSDLIVAAQIRILRSGNHTNDTTSNIFYGINILDFNPIMGSKIYNEKIFISNDFATKRRNLNCFSRIGVCKDSFGNLKYKIHFSF